MASHRRLLLLRGINVGGHKKVPMTDLRDLLTGIGCTDVATLINSGNAVVSTPTRSPERLAASIEDAISGRFGFDVTVVVRTPAEMAAVTSGNPLARDDRDPSRLLVRFFAELPPGRTAFEALDLAPWAPHEFRLVGRELYGWYPNGLSQAPKTLPDLERVLGSVGTSRNWRTTLRLADLLGRQLEAGRIR